ncbi:hypothetical protein CVT24_005756 [Panaeolus cyanescens]|uniref:Uncharacterized protein n=1 Tax=Panaeolus cyanescens TaxID=181874 RepID=A0A409V969_9AGAR|nr:hypothetical protein CVT24_005756 [Panaeolus cyanescens]
MFKRTLFAFAFFPVLSVLSVKNMFGRLNDSGVAHTVGVDYCTPGLSKYAPTGNNAIDNAICPLIAFFHILMDNPSSFSLLFYSLIGGAPLVVLPLIEGHRTGQRSFFKYPNIWLLISQVASVGFTFPLYYSLLILSGSWKKLPEFNDKSFPQHKVQAIVFSVMAGALIPTLAMLFMKDPTVTAIWQIYPLCISVAYFLHILVVRSPQTPKSGYRALQGFYLVSFILSSSIHMATAVPLFADITSLRHLLVPALTPLDNSVPVASHLHDFLKWDVTLAYTSTALAFFWLCSSVKQVVCLFTWLLFAIPVFGFGAATMGAAMWKEGLLQ